MGLLTEKYVENKVYKKNSSKNNQNYNYHRAWHCSIVYFSLWAFLSGGPAAAAHACSVRCKVIVYIILVRREQI